MICTEPTAVPVASALAAPLTIVTVLPDPGSTPPANESASSTVVRRSIGYTAGFATAPSTVILRP